MKQLKRSIVTLALSLIVGVALTGCSARVEGHNEKNEAVQLTEETNNTMHDVSVLFINAGKADSILV